MRVFKKFNEFTQRYSSFLNGEYIHSVNKNMAYNALLNVYYALTGKGIEEN